jgi:hypothetical protein
MNKGVLKAADVSVVIKFKFDANDTWLPVYYVPA